MKKIIYVTRSLDIGGIEKKICSIVRNIDKTKYVPIVVCLKKGGVLKKEIENYNVKVKVFNKFTFFFELIYFLFKFKPDIVHSYNYTGNLWSALALIFYREAKFIVEITNITKWDIFRRILNIFVYYKADKIAVISKAVGKFALKNEIINKKKLFLLYNSYDETEFYRIKSNIREELKFTEQEFIFGTVARLDHPDKGHEILIKAVNMIRNLDFKVILAGSGSSEEFIKEMVKQYKLEHKILFLGMRKDVSNILSGIDCFVLSSISEGFGSTIVEAFACKTPVICSDAGGIKEIITKLSVLSFKNKDHKELSILMKKVINNKNILKELSANGYLRAKKFTLTKKLEKMECLYKI